ncbi:MAG: hypothetical protein N4A47_06415 [Clostridia bacterium]|jgi:hypothetical protein|nr:hypothetical protein [Clostridia bacterium]
MKKFIIILLALTAAASGGFYVYDNYVNKGDDIKNLDTEVVDSIDKEDTNLANYEEKIAELRSIATTDDPFEVAGAETMVNAAWLKFEGNYNDTAKRQELKQLNKDTLAKAVDSLNSDYEKIRINQQIIVQTEQSFNEKVTNAENLANDVKMAYENTEDANKQEVLNITQTVVTKANDAKVRYQNVKVKTNDQVTRGNEMIQAVAAYKATVKKAVESK